jgi:hypothetical protein
MHISEILAPAHATQRYIPPAAPARPPRLDQTDQQMIALVREQGPIGIWRLLSQLANDEGFASRAEGRQLRLALWARLHRLLRLRLLFRVERTQISINAPPAKTKKTRPIRRTLLPKAHDPVRPHPIAGTVSTSFSADGSREAHVGQQPHDELIDDALPDSPSATSESKIKTAATREEVSAAARELAELPRRPKRRWSGWLSDEWHGYKNQRVVLPNGEVWFLYGALRGKAVVTPDRGQLLGGWGDGPFRWCVLPAESLRPWKDPKAVTLGHCKLGVREKPSRAKQIACRINGSRPTSEGRKRGRPAHVHNHHC